MTVQDDAACDNPPQKAWITGRPATQVKLAYPTNLTKKSCNPNVLPGWSYTTGWNILHPSQLLI